MKQNVCLVLLSLCTLGLASQQSREKEFRCVHGALLFQAEAEVDHCCRGVIDGV
jgi:hypothetical protein